MGQREEGVVPKIPYRLQKYGAGAEVQHCPACRPQQGKQAEFSVCAPQQKLKARSADAQAVRAVQRHGEAGKPQPEGPQQVVPDPRSKTQQNGLGKIQQLLGYLVTHTQPKSRPKKPWPDRGCSS